MERELDTNDPRRPPRLQAVFVDVRTADGRDGDGDAGGVNGESGGVALTIGLLLLLSSLSSSVSTLAAVVSFS